MTNSLMAMVAAAAVAAVAIPTHADAQLQRQEATVAAGIVELPPGVVGLPPGVPATIATTTYRVYTYEPVCQVRREQFSDEYGWRVRSVRVCY